MEWATEFVIVWNKTPFKLWLCGGRNLFGLFRSVLKMQRLDVATGRHLNLLFRFGIVILSPKCLRVLRLLTKMHLSTVHLLPKSSSLVTGRYDNKQFDTHFFKDTSQSSFNILSFQILLLVKVERVNQCLAVQLCGIKYYIHFYNYVVCCLSKIFWIQWTSKNKPQIKTKKFPWNPTENLQSKTLYGGGWKLGISWSTVGWFLES